MLSFIGARTECRRTNRRGQIVADKMSHGQNVAGQFVAGQMVADKMLRTKRRKKFVAWTKRRTDKWSHRQIVAWTKRCKDKMLHGRNVARTKCCTDKILQ